MTRSLWFVSDIAIIYLSFWGAAYLLNIPITQVPEGLTGIEAGLATGVFGCVLLSIGAYRHAVRTIHLRRFFQIGVGVLGAALGATALTYFWDPSRMFPRNIVAVHTLLVLVGILGSRALVRLVMEIWHHPEPSSVPPEPISLYDVVHRSPPTIDTQGLRDELADRTVLVTGAGGSIGRELTLQLARMHPFRLVGVDMSEYNLYRLQHTLHDDADERAGSRVDLHLADVRDTQTMSRIFQRTTPDVVIHTAAYKHVPLMERHPAEAFRNNTRATMQLLHLCEEHGTEQFLFVSTDKAVQPTSVLGATKRMAEWYVRAATSPVTRKIVRFGNVFGSRGSVVPRFERRLKAGRPIPVTHPDMERYFMSAEEACSLIMHTLLLNSHPVYLFRMGEPVRILDLAKQLVQRWYPNCVPESMIEHVGRRPGEKLSETLAMPGEQAEDTAHPSIIGVQGAMPYSRAELDLHIQHLKQQCRQTDISPAQMRRLIVGTPSTTSTHTTS